MACQREFFDECDMGADLSSPTFDKIAHRCDRREIRVNYQQISVTRLGPRSIQTSQR